MMKQNLLEALAADAGYDNERDYATDKDLHQCEDCERWGEADGEVTPYPDGKYDVVWLCGRCLRMRDAEARGGQEPRGG